MSSAALTSPSAERNKGAIGDVLAKYIPEGSNKTEPTLVGLEIAAGYGSHMMYNSERFPQVNWIITEKDPNCINSLVAHINSACPSRANIKGPFTLDLSAAMKTGLMKLSAMKAILILCCQLTYYILRLGKMYDPYLL